MTHLLFLPDEQTLLLWNVAMDAATLLAAIQSGAWQPPSPYQGLFSGRGWQAVLVRGLVIVTPPEADLPNFSDAQALPPRQYEILELMAEGLTTKQIAQRLKISRRTVALHVAALKQRLGVQTRAESVGRAVALGYYRLKRPSPPD